MRGQRPDRCWHEAALLSGKSTFVPSFVAFVPSWRSFSLCEALFSLL
jgi:hypothetical protein